MGPSVRIMLRYGIGILAGAVGISVAPDLGERLASDPDIVFLLATGLAGLVELIYARAKRNGGAL